MQMPDMPVHVPIDDPNADTEWNDILRKHGVIPEKPPSPTPLIQEALEQARALAHENRLEGKDLDELAALEDTEDAAFLETYRQKRMAELSALTTASVHNQVYPIHKPDYPTDVTAASYQTHVLVLLTSSHGSNTESRVLEDHWRTLSARFGDVKFCQMRADLCIEGYPEGMTPTVLVYRDGEIVRQVVTLKGLRGVGTSVGDLEGLLVEVGAVKGGDGRLGGRLGGKREGVEEEEVRKKAGAGGIRQGGRGNRDDDNKEEEEEEDSDWDC